MTSCFAPPQRRLHQVLAGFVALGILAVVFAPPVGAADVVPLNVGVQATDGTGTSEHPGRPCAEGGEGAYWHYGYGTKVAPGVFPQGKSLQWDLRANLDLHSDIVRFPNSAGTYAPPPPGATAFLQGDGSHVSLLNQRGSIKLRMTSGNCAQPKLAFDGSIATGDGDWAVGGGAGAYRAASGSGGFTLKAEVNPGADNALDLKLNGNLQVLHPSLKVEKVTTYWGSLGTDYLTRRVTVVYKVTNSGPGDSFGARMVSATSSTPGVKALGPQDQPLGDLLEGDTRMFKVRYELGLEKPCQLVVLGCTFDTAVTVQMPDALDVPHTFTADVMKVKAPDLPPPLSEVSIT